MESNHRVWPKNQKEKEESEEAQEEEEEFIWINGVGKVFQMRSQ